MTEKQKDIIIYKPTYNSNTEFCTDIFLAKQHQIAMKYETADSINFNIIGETEWTKKFDAYLLHALEEASETYVEMQNWDPLTSRKPKDLLEELMDVTMYLGSLDLLLYENIKVQPFVGLGYEITIEENTTLSISHLQNDYKSIKLALLEVISQVTMLRRKLPARKWHKHKPADDRDLSVLLPEIFSLRNNIATIICNIMMIALVIAEGSDVVLNDILTSKQDKVLSL